MNVVNIGSHVYARFSADGAYYMAIVQGINGEFADILFFDNVREWVPLQNVLEISRALSSMPAHGNMKNQGYYYPCQILSLEWPHVVIKYIEDGVVERVLYEQVRLIPVST